MWGNHLIFWGYEGRIWGYLYAFVSSLLNKSKQDNLKSKSPWPTLSKADSLALLASSYHLGVYVPWGVFCTCGCGVALCFFPEKRDSGVPSPAALLIACIQFLRQSLGPGLFFISCVRWIHPMGSQPKKLKLNKKSKAKYCCFRSVPDAFWLFSFLFFKGNRQDFRSQSFLPQVFPTSNWYEKTWETLLCM